MKLLLFKLSIAMCCEKHVLHMEYNCVGQNKKELKIIETLRIITELFYSVTIQYLIILLIITEIILLK